MGKSKVVFSELLQQWYIARINADGTMSADKREIPEETISTIMHSFIKKRLGNSIGCRIPFLDEKLEKNEYHVFVCKGDNFLAIDELVKRAREKYEQK